jgi:antirestriction protein ArdC
MRCAAEGNGRKQALSSLEPQRAAAVFNFAQCDHLPDHCLASAPGLPEREVIPLPRRPACKPDRIIRLLAELLPAE